MGVMLDGLCPLLIYCHVSKDVLIVWQADLQCFFFQAAHLVPEEEVP